LIFALIGAHLYLVVKLGTTAPPWMKAGRPKSAMRREEVG
jgi:menaquinol-cytochrome c reductase cytochrome b subunit